MLIGFFVGLGSTLFHRSPQSPSTASGSAPSLPTTDPAISAYLSKITIGSVKVSKTDLGGDGVFGEIKNEGDRTLKEVELTIYCLNPAGKRVFEKPFRPVLVSEFSFGDSNQPLKPGYSRQFGVKVNDAPSDWSKKVDVKVTSLQFE
jgi:hypothetical protein